MFISNNIQIDVDEVLKEINLRQVAPWNDGRINDYEEFPHLNKLYQIINSGIPKEDFFFKGDLFRIHTSYVCLESEIDPNKGFRISKVCSDGSCSMLPYTEYTKKLVAFCKSHDFTNRRVFNKVSANEKSVILHVNTKSHYGIDVNVFQQRFSTLETRYSKEQEVLFPLLKEYVVKEYIATPNKTNYYLRRFATKEDANNDQL